MLSAHGSGQVKKHNVCCSWKHKGASARRLQWSWIDPPPQTSHDTFVRPLHTSQLTASFFCSTPSGREATGAFRVLMGAQEDGMQCDVQGAEHLNPLV